MDVDLSSEVVSDITAGVLLLNEETGRLLFLPYAGELITAYDLNKGEVLFSPLRLERDPDHGMRLAAVRILKDLGAVYLTESTLARFLEDCTLAWRRDEEFDGWVIEGVTSNEVLLVAAIGQDESSTRGDRLMTEVVSMPDPKLIPSGDKYRWPLSCDLRKRDLAQRWNTGDTAGLIECGKSILRRLPPFRCGLRDGQGLVDVRNAILALRGHEPRSGARTIAHLSTRLLAHRCLGQGAIVEMHDTIAEPAFLQQFQLNAGLARECRLPFTDEHRMNEEVALID